MTNTLESPQATPKLLTVREVAERLQVSIWTAYRKVESGEIPAVKLGPGRMAPVRVDPAELQAWLTEEPA